MRLFAGTVSAALVGGLCVFGATAQGLASAKPAGHASPQ